MAMFVMMAFETLDERVVEKKRDGNSESSTFLSRLVACSLHEQTERANNDLQRGKAREHPTPQSYLH